MFTQEKLDELRQSLNQETVVMILIYIGYDVNRNYKFKLREGESTASASIRNDSSNPLIVDFGGDFKGDIISLLQIHQNMTFEAAVQYVATCTGVEL